MRMRERERERERDKKIANLKIAQMEVDVLTSVQWSDPALSLACVEGFDGSAAHCSDVGPG